MALISFCLLLYRDLADAWTSNMTKRRSKLSNKNKIPHRPLVPELMYNTTQWLSRRRDKNEDRTPPPTELEPSVVGQSLSGEAERLFVYSHLQVQQEIRLLSVTSGDSAATPCLFSLSIWSRADVPDYETLSYVWGDNNRRHKLQFKDGTFLMITDSLAEAIPRLAKCSSTKLFWIDQVSINQADLLERNQNVKIMGNIYRQCFRVLIILTFDNKCDSHLSKLLDVAEDNDTDEEALDRGVEALLSFEPLSAPINSVDSRSFHTQTAYLCQKAVQRVLEDSWFIRGWTFQEAALPGLSDFMIGDRIVSFEILWRLLAAVSRFESKHNDFLRGTPCTLLSPAFDHVCSLATSRGEYTQQGRGTQSFWELLSDTAPTTQCTEAIDKVYAFLGLYTDTEVVIEPDYSISLRRAMINTTRAIIRGTGSLAIFGFVDRQQNPYPTWCCNWPAQVMTTPLWKFSQMWEFNAALDRPFHPAGHDWLDRLEVRGNEVDRIVFVCDTMFDSVMHWQRLDPVQFLQLYEILRDISHQNNFRRNQPGITESYDPGYPRLLRVLMANGVFQADNAQPLTDEELAKCTTAYLERQAHRTDRRTEEIDRICDLTRIARGRRVCLTQEGKLGLVPWAAQAGDIISIVHGSNVPLILRKRSLPPVGYRLIGQAYVEDMMNGQAVSWAVDDAKRFSIV